MSFTTIVDALGLALVFSGEPSITNLQRHITAWKVVTIIQVRGIPEKKNDMKKQPQTIEEVIQALRWLNVGILEGSVIAKATELCDWDVKCIGRKLGMKPDELSEKIQEMAVGLCPEYFFPGDMKSDIECFELTEKLILVELLKELEKGTIVIWEVIKERIHRDFFWRIPEDELPSDTQPSKK